MPDPTQPVLSPPSAFVADANGDGGVTLGDFPGWFPQLFFLPGDWSMWLIAKYAPPVASILGGDTPHYGGFVSGFFAVAFWSLVLIVLGTGYTYLVELDRRATRASSRIYGEIRRAVRVASRLLRARFRRGEPREKRDALDFSSEIELSALETRLLKELVELAPGYTSAAPEIAHSLRLASGEIRGTLEGLVTRGLVLRTLGGEDGESAYAPSAAGRAALLMRQLS